MIFLQLATGQQAFVGAASKALRDWVKERLSSLRPVLDQSWPKNCFTAFVSLGMKMCRSDQDQRPDLEAVIDSVSEWQLLAPSARNHAPAAARALHAPPPRPPQRHPADGFGPPFLPHPVDGFVFDPLRNQPQPQAMSPRRAAVELEPGRYERYQPVIDGNSASTV